MSSGIPRQLGVSDDPVGSRVSLRDCMLAALQQSEGLVDKVLDSLMGRSDKVFGAVVKPNFPVQAQATLDILLAQRNTVKAHFNKHLRECVFEGVGVDAQAPQMMRFEDLKLFEEEDLDESIEIARVLQEISQQVDEVLPALDALVSTLLGWTTVQPQINPLRPEMFARALRESFADQIEDADIRAALLAPAGGRLGILLRKVYLELISWLKSSGVESAALLPPGQVQSSVTKPGVADAVGTSVARTLLTLDRLRRLLSGELDTGAARNPKDFLHTVPASVVALQDMRQVEAMVKRLEVKAKAAAQNPDADEARKRAAERMALTDSKHLGKQLGEEVVRLMLDNLIEDQRLLSQVRAQLQTLEPLLMQIAQTDGRFFSDKQHAARQFLDRVTSRSLAFASERDDGYKPFVQSIEKSIASITSNAQTGTNVSQAFDDVMESLNAVWARQDAEERARREEAARALMHAEQRNMLAQYLAQDFKRNAEGIEVPQSVVDFACGPWAQVVAESQLRSTNGVSDPQGYQELVTELYWSVQPRVAKRNRRRLVQIIPGMLGKMRKGLQLIEFPQERITDFFAQLIGMHEAALEAGKPKPSANAQVIDQPDSALPSDEDNVDLADLEALYAAADDPVTQSATDQPPNNASAQLENQAPGSQASRPWLGKNEAVEAGFVEEASVTLNPLAESSNGLAEQATPAIALGTWVELMREGQWVRAQLTWASPHRSLFMFISRGGRTHSMSRRTMDKLRQQDMIRVVSEGHLVDKALDAVAQTALRNSADRPPNT